MRVNRGLNLLASYTIKCPCLVLIISIDISLKKKDIVSYFTATAENKDGILFQEAEVKAFSSLLMVLSFVLLCVIIHCQLFYNF